MLTKITATLATAVAALTLMSGPAHADKVGVLCRDELRLVTRTDATGVTTTRAVGRCFAGPGHQYRLVAQIGGELVASDWRHYPYRTRVVVPDGTYVQAWQYQWRVG